MCGQIVPTAEMRLIAVCEIPLATRALPERPFRMLRHGTSLEFLKANHGIETSLAFEAIPKGDRFLFHPDSVHDGNHGTRLEYKSWQHRAELVNRQRIVAIQHHIPTPVAHSYNEQLDLEIGGCLPFGENLQNPLLCILVLDRRALRTFV